MKKEAKLVYVSLLVRVEVEQGSSDKQIVDCARVKLIEKVIDSSLIDNVEEIIDDIECPCNN